MSERAGRDQRVRMNGVILVSLLFHALILSLLFFAPSFPSPKLTFGPVYTVSLVNLSSQAPQQRQSAAAVKELMQAQTPRAETALKKQVAPEPAVPIHSLESRVKKDQTLEKAMEEIRKRAAATPATPKKAPPAAPDAPKAAAPPAPSSPSSPGTPGEAEMNAKMRAYYAMIWGRIKGRWALPEGILPGAVYEAVIDVTILRTGAVTDVNFEKRSGNRYFDESAMKAIRKASPFPPLPSWVEGGSLDVGIRFHSSELRS